MSEHRGHWQHETDDIGDMVDYISNLPDCILDEILSFMPTKEVVKTSILSTRWKNLWASVPTFDFDDRLLWGRMRPDVTSIVNSVKRVLQLRDASNMKKFRLSCQFFRDTSIIHSWISHAIMHNVQELDLELHRYMGPSVIPESMFESISLISLKIRMDCDIELPSHVSFPFLKTLHLSFVWSLDNDFTEKLFSGCPVLEELVLSNCRCLNSKYIAISSSTLKSLTIRDLLMFGEFGDPTSGYKMKIDAPNLTYLEYSGFLSNQILLNNTSSLEKSIINVSHPSEKLDEVTCRAIDLLEQLKYVVSLRLSNLSMETLSFADNIRFPVLPNLTHLMLTMEIGMDRTLRVLMHLLSLCPVLQSISFSEGFMDGMHLGENDLIWSSIPKCISNSLKTVTLNNFRGYKSEVCFLKWVLKYARVLERMDIWWSETCLQGLKRRKMVIKGLENFERSSTACVINFSPGIKTRYNPN